MPQSRGAQINILQRVALLYEVLIEIKNVALVLEEGHLRLHVRESVNNQVHLDGVVVGASGEVGRARLHAEPTHRLHKLNKALCGDRLDVD